MFVIIIMKFQRIIILSVFNLYHKKITKLEGKRNPSVTCNIHRSALDYSIIRLYTNVVYYKYYYYH